jgi:hypothetical protein
MKQVAYVPLFMEAMLSGATVIYRWAVDDGINVMWTFILEIETILYGTSSWVSALVLMS